VLARVAASRWPVAPCFEEAKGEAGLDHYQVRHWHSCHRHITLAMRAHGFVAWQRRPAGEKAVADRRALGAAECAGDPALARADIAAAAPHGGPRPALLTLAPAPASARLGLS